MHLYANFNTSVYIFYITSALLLRNYVMFCDLKIAKVAKRLGVWGAYSAPPYRAPPYPLAECVGIPCGNPPPPKSCIRHCNMLHITTKAILKKNIVTTKYPCLICELVHEEMQLPPQKRRRYPMKSLECIHQNH